MPISIKDTSGNTVAMTNAQKSQFIADLGITPTTIGAIPASAAGTTGLAVLGGG